MARVDFNNIKHFNSLPKFMQQDSFNNSLYKHLGEYMKQFYDSTKNYKYIEMANYLSNGDCDLIAKSYCIDYYSVTFDLETKRDVIRKFFEHKNKPHTIIELRRLLKSFGFKIDEVERDMTTTTTVHSSSDIDSINVCNCKNSSGLQLIIGGETNFDIRNKLYYVLNKYYGNAIRFEKTYIPFMLYSIIGDNLFGLDVEDLLEEKFTFTCKNDVFIWQSQYEPMSCAIESNYMYLYFHIRESSISNNENVQITKVHYKRDDIKYEDDLHNKYYKDPDHPDEYLPIIIKPIQIDHHNEMRIICLRLERGEL